MTPGLIGRERAVAADEAERERIGHVDAAETVRRRDHRNAEILREGSELAACLRERDAVTDEQSRALRAQDQVERGGNLFGRSAAALRAVRRRGRRDLD